MRTTTGSISLGPHADSDMPHCRGAPGTAMVMLSALRRFHLVDGYQRRGRLLDVAVDLLNVDYPPVTQFVFRKHAEHRSLPWNAIQSIDWRARQIQVTDLEASQVISPASPQEDVLLKRDILDALIIDLQNRRVTRANDLWLEEQEACWRLAAADTSVRAIVRRLSRGLYGQVKQSTLYDWKYIEFLRGNPSAVRSGAGYHRRITRLPSGEIARLTDSLPYLHAAELLILLPDPLAADTLEVMAPERQLQVFEELDEEQALRILALMAPDIAADLVACLDTRLAQRYLNRLPKQYSERIVDLLRYPKDTVGGIMTNDIITAPAHLTVQEARHTLHERLKEPDFVYFVFIIEDEKTQRLCGVLTLRELLIAEEECCLHDIMRPYMVTSQPLEPACQAAYRLIDNGLAALPVVGHDGQLLGAITVDAAVAQVAPASWSTQAPRVFT